jgi:hypothetical protein
MRQYREVFIDASYVWCKLITRVHPSSCLGDTGQFDVMRVPKIMSRFPRAAGLTQVSESGAAIFRILACRCIREMGAHTFCVASSMGFRGTNALCRNFKAPACANPSAAGMQHSNSSRKEPLRPAWRTTLQLSASIIFALKTA